MYLQRNRPDSAGRVSLCLIQRGVDPATGKSCTTYSEYLGYEDELRKEYLDPVAHFEQVADEMNKEMHEHGPTVLLRGTNGKMSVGTDSGKNLGYAAASCLYHQFRIDQFLRNRQRHSNEQFDANSIVQLLLYNRMLYPDSNKSAYEHRQRFFMKEDYSLSSVYRCLTLLAKHSNALQTYIEKQLLGDPNSITFEPEVLFYDVSNVWFEIDLPDDLRRKGFSKEHRSDPIVQLGLFTSEAGMPMRFRLFPGNTSDCTTYTPIFDQIRQDIPGTRKIVTVADKAMCTGNNIWHLTQSAAPAGYIFSMGVRGASEEMKKYVLDASDYVPRGNDGFRFKSRQSDRKIYVTGPDGKRRTKTVTEQHVAFYSPKYAKKARAERAERIEKARKLIANPSEYSRSSSYGAAAYVKDILVDEKTGEVINPVEALVLNEEKIREEEKLDGYYLLATSELQMPAEEVIEHHNRQHEIEDAFRLLKTDLALRPVHVSRPDHIQAHFTICIIALLITRMLCRAAGCSPARLLNSLRECMYYPLNGNIFHAATYYNDVLDALGNKLDLPFGELCLTVGDLRSALAHSKKRISLL